MEAWQKLEKANALIFDLGGVIIDIDPSLTLDALGKLPHRREEGLSIQKLTRLSVDYETGKVSTPDFRDELKNLLSTYAVNDMIDTAWNRMLLGIESEKIALLRQLSERYRLFLLSNTNPLHLKEVLCRLKEVSGYADFSLIFEKCYYSFEAGIKKPETTWFSQVIKENDLDAGRTVFLDDLKENLVGAEKAGLQTIHVENSSQLYEIFSYEPQA